MQRVLRPVERERVIAKRDGQIGPVYLGNLSSHLEVLPWQVKSSGVTDRGPEIFLWKDLIFCLNYHLCFFKLQKTLVLTFHTFLVEFLDVRLCPRILSALSSAFSKQYMVAQTFVTIFSFVLSYMWILSYRKCHIFNNK